MTFSRPYVKAGDFVVETADCPNCGSPIPFCVMDYKSCPYCAKWLPQVLLVSDNEIARLAYYNKEQ